MKKKGFTLIELLAVIVILAIIALIATPLVLKYIEKSMKESKVDSAYSFVRNLETEIANYSIKHNGKKYNKSGLVEIGDLTDIDTTVKGDKPDAIKVCLSSLGQVDKAMFEYGNYYVSYDGKKGSISDKDTYDNFSCSDNGENNLEDILFETDATFVDGQMATVDINKTIFDKFNKPGHDYVVIIDDEHVFTTFSLEISQYGLFQMVSDDMFPGGVNGVNVVVSEQEFQIYTNFSIENPNGVHNIKICYPKETNNNSYFYILSDGEIAILDYDFVGSNASVLIDDESGNVYFNEVVALKDNMNFGIYGVDCGCRSNGQLLPEVYTAINQGKKIKITVTQNIDGKDVVTTIDTQNIKKYPETEDYYIGRTFLQSTLSC